VTACRGWILSLFRPDRLPRAVLREITTASRLLDPHINRLVDAPLSAPGHVNGVTFFIFF
jgi:hypothetical protein